MTEILDLYTPSQLAEIAYLMGRIEGFEALVLSRSGALFEHPDHKRALNAISFADARLDKLGCIYSPDLLTHYATGNKYSLDTILANLEFCEFTEHAKSNALAERKRQYEEFLDQLDEN